MKKKIEMATFRVYYHSVGLVGLILQLQEI